MCLSVFLRGRLGFCFIIFFIGIIWYQFVSQLVVMPECGPFKEYMRKIINFNLSDGEEKNLLNGLFLGERQNVSRELTTVLRNTSTIHILAISGDHIGFIGVTLVAVLRLLLVPKKAAALAGLVFVVVYVSVVGWQAPSFRAVVMFTVFALGWIIDRPASMVNSLALAAIIILFVLPDSLFEAGFQLSFMIVFVLLISSPLINGGNVKKIFLVSAIAWIASMPLIAYYFSIVSPIAIIANLVMVVGVSIVLSIGFASVLFGSIYIAVSGIFNVANHCLVKVLIKYLKFLSEIPFSCINICQITPSIVIGSYIIILSVFFFLSYNRQNVIK